MIPVLAVFFAQFCITGADVYVKRKIHLFAPAHIKQWVSQYAVLRYTGLILRLAALFFLPVAAAATLFSSAAIGMSSAVAHIHGERFSKRELVAIGLIVIAVILRGLA